MPRYKFRAKGPNVILATVVAGLTVTDHVSALAAYAMGLDLIKAAKDANPDVDRLHEQVSRALPREEPVQTPEPEEEEVRGPLPPHPGTLKLTHAIRPPERSLVHGRE